MAPTPATVLPELTTSAPPTSHLRPGARGKFLFVGDEKLYLRGVTYGPFRPQRGSEYPHPRRVERDFAAIAGSGLNAVRLYSVPPRRILDSALRQGLRVMVGLPWEQHVAFLDAGRARAIEQRVRSGVRACAGHPAVLCYAVGNEIPAAIVRWTGRRRIERYVRRLYEAAKEEDPAALATYVNYPSTEYLQLPFLDLVCFNVYLECPKRLDAYVARLQNIAGDRPLILTELGLDSRRNGEEEQARSLERQVHTAFTAGCAGAFVFAWTDEWHRGGYEIEDWDFGVTRRDGRSKPSLAAVRQAFAEVPFPAGDSWPRFSVVVCVHNGERTARHCFDGLAKLAYPDFEVIVVDDGSTDATASLAREYGFRLISTPRRGLGNARNTGLEAATGEIVAYLDADASPDRHWLTYLAAEFLRTDHAGIGGPNIQPAGDDPLAECVANAPGGPIHVLLTDREAEHIPGCNMAFRRLALEAIGGFDPRFRIAGDDVDVCWQLQQRGWTLGFSPPAFVWHHHRETIGAFCRQQLGYGRAEALLEAKWPDRYNAAGHPTWSGRVYARVGLERVVRRAGRIYHGTWGAAPFQALEPGAPSLLWSLPAMPEWNLILFALSAFSALGALWRPLLLSLPVLAFMAGLSLVQAWRGAATACFPSRPRSRTARSKLRVLTAFLHLLQPAVRLAGRLPQRLTPWRLSGAPGFMLPRPRHHTLWSARWEAAGERLQELERTLRSRRAVILRGGQYARWDLEVRGGVFGAARVRMAVEEHGGGRQCARFRYWPRCSPVSLAVMLLLGVLSTTAFLDGARLAGAILGGAALLFALRSARDCAAGMAALQHCLRRGERPGAEEAAKDERGDDRQDLPARTGHGRVPDVR